MPSYSQSVTLTYVAWDTSANSGKTGDVANHTLRWIKDGTSSAPTNTPTEVDATNAPGVYKLTLTSGECSCNVGTLAGKSSTANITIIPVTLSFELIPTVASGSSGGLPVLDGNSSVPSNLKYIDGQATSGNNAILKLKSLDLRSNDAAVSSLIIRGAAGGAGVNGGYAVDIVGGAGGTGTTSGGDAIYAAGGAGTSARGYGLNLAAPNSGQSGLLVSGNYTSAAANFVGDSYTDGIRVTGGYGWAGGIRANIKGDIYGSLNLRFKKNTGINNFMFPMFDSTTKQPKSGLTVSASRAIDGNSYAPCSNSVAELSDGTYRINFSADDLNGDKIMFRFYATGADDQMVEIITQD